MRFTTFWDELSNLGINEGLPLPLRKKIVLCNRLAFTVGVVIFLSSFTYYQVPLLFGLYLIAGLMYSSPLLFNFLGHYDLSRFMLVVAPPFYIILGAGWASEAPAVGLKYALLSVLIMPVLLFQASESRKMWLGLGWVMTTLLLYDPLTLAIPRLKEISSDAEFDDSVAQNTGMMVSFILFVAAFLYQQRVNLRTEQQLQETLRQAKRKNQIISEKNEQLNEQYGAIEQQKAEIESMNRELRLQALKAQINPHFVFNALNSIQHFVMQKDTKEALGYLTKFARLIRQILENSVNETIPIADELKALTYYLDLERLRFNESFAYQIEIDEQIDAFTTEIPAMLLQPYIENAILHGLRHRRGGGGELKIWVLYQFERLLCVVEDNGVGREASAQLAAGKVPGHISRGTAVTNNRLRLLNDSITGQVSVVTLDLYDEQRRPRGTRVEVLIPL
ncbi:hypothetical protein GCM10027275_07370 [Rhabdobacter roseus]|uniref:Signal transduction histidine kinase internal region domain-containing protein n=1 Tax=Rhabdobacter roseus TaxID=1655419 RepID=A0A840TGN3_9BACT|nr:sensor histidine kinase [Rhabdobacter roseus]MBB5282634.1 hypothetical protein [Rhabdobacter roseus]